MAHHGYSIIIISIHKIAKYNSQIFVELIYDRIHKIIILIIQQFRQRIFLPVPDKGITRIPAG